MEVFGCFCLRKVADYHEAMDNKNCVIKKVLPLLDENTIIVLHNVHFHLCKKYIVMNLLHFINRYKTRYKNKITSYSKDVMHEHHLLKKQLLVIV